MQLFETPSEIFSFVESAKAGGQKVGVVPTMGALHEGHLSLVEAARKSCDTVVATIFVNPTQFSPNEDLKKYPRPIENDLNHLRGLNVDAVFCPSNESIYPPGYSTYVEPPKIADPFEGESRHTHFRGVATVVLKLFQMIPASNAFFGQKDFQQTLVIKKMVEDLNIPTNIVVCPIVREPDGLAMSSRNVYLSESERKRALAIHQTLVDTREKLLSGMSISDAIELGKQNLIQSVDSLEYFDIVDPNSLTAIQSEPETAVALVAAKVGATRLIDNELIDFEQRLTETDRT